jgi:phosphohistidine swiveling domain-containing protein
LSLINAGNGIIGIDYAEMNRVKSNLKRARDKSTELNRRINSAITKLQVDKNSSRIKMATDQLRDYSRQVTRMQGDMDRTINKVDKAIRRFKEVDSACAARIRAIGGDESEKKSFLEDAEEGIISLGNKIEGKLEGLLEEGTKIFKEVTGFASEWMDKHPLAVDVIGAVGDVAAIVVTVAAITASAPVVAVVGAAIGVVFAANSLLDEGTKIYNNLRSGSNKGFNAIETGFKDVLGNSAGEIAYEGTNIVGVAVSLPSALRSGVEIISGVKNIIQEGSLLEEGEKLFSSIKETSGEIGNSLNTVKQLITGEKSITVRVLDAGIGLRMPNISVIDNDIEKISKIEDVNVSGLEGDSKVDFTGKLRGEDIILKGVKTEEISYVKRDTLELNNLRNDFNKTVRNDFLKDLSKNTDYLKEVGFSDKDILKMKNGRVPDGWQVHHKLPLDDSGTNNFDNLVLIQNEPYHKVITNFQNSFAKELKIGEIKEVEWPIPDGNIYPPKH